MILPRIRLLFKFLRYETNNVIQYSNCAIPMFYSKSYIQKLVEQRVSKWARGNHGSYMCLVTRDGTGLNGNLPV